ncbi:hypothetical protein [Streptomyces sp. CRN 30]|uniref:hypothetical protein n=1 Tax=Streptomyces sp. CRN 30 TaxID=3075613 RepID=UPI002A7F3338|nr:hypothetical protein [Streptomyces sp. CRN 30]
MRALYVPARLAATMMAVAATAGCMSVGNDGAGPAPSLSAQRRDGAEPDGGPTVSGGEEAGHRTGHGGRGASAEPRASAAAKASPSASASGSPEPSTGSAPEHGTGGQDDGPPGPEPTEGEPSPSRTTEEPTPTQEPVSPTPEPSTPEPSSSAHEQGTQLLEREPAPRAGRAA